LCSVPWRLIGQRVDARETWTTVRIFHNGTLVATHARAECKRTDMSHYPPEKIAFAMRTPTWRRTTSPTSDHVPSPISRSTGPYVGRGIASLSVSAMPHCPAPAAAPRAERLLISYTIGHAYPLDSDGE